MTNSPANYGSQHPLEDPTTAYITQMAATPDEQRASMTADFMAAFLRGDMGAAAEFAGRTYLDHSKDPRNPVKRYPTMGEVAYESLDHARGPQQDELYAFLAQHAQRGDVAALSLIQRMGAAYAHYHVED